MNNELKAFMVELLEDDGKNNPTVHSNEARALLALAITTVAFATLCIAGYSWDISCIVSALVFFISVGLLFVANKSK